VEDWLVPGRNPFGLYLHIEEVDALAAAFGREVLGKNGPENKSWGMYGCGRHSSYLVCYSSRDANISVQTS
jgi:hypothetical protein